MKCLIGAIILTMLLIFCWSKLFPDLYFYTEDAGLFGTPKISINGTFSESDLILLNNDSTLLPSDWYVILYIKIILGIHFVQ